METILGALQTPLARCLPPSVAIAPCKTARDPYPPPRLHTCVLPLLIRLFRLLHPLPVFVPAPLNPKMGICLIPVVRLLCIPPFFLVWPRPCVPASCSLTPSRTGSRIRTPSMGVRQSTRLPISSKPQTVTLRSSWAARSTLKSFFTLSLTTIGYVILPRMCTSSARASEAPSTLESSHRRL